MLKILSANFFNVIQKNINLFEYEEILHAQFCKLITTFPRPFSSQMILWLYFRLEDFILIHKEKLNESRELILSSRKLFVSNLYGVRLVSSAFIDYIKQILTTNNYNTEVINTCLIILLQLNSSSSNFTVREENKKKIEDIGLGMQQLDDYIKIQNDIVSFLKSILTISKMSNECLCTLLWVSALSTLQTRSTSSCLSYMKIIIDKYLYDGFDERVLDSKGFMVIVTALDAIEVLLFSIEINQSVNRDLEHIVNMLAHLADSKLPIKGTNLFRKQVLHEHFEKIIERLIYVSLIILNLSSLISSYSVVKSLVNIIAASKKLEHNKTITEFNYTEIIQFANSALEWILINSQKHKISTYLSNFDTVLKLDLLDPSVPKKYLLIKNAQCLITLYELEARKETYEVLILIRRDFGLYAYYAELLHIIKEVEECENRIEDVKRESVEKKSLISEEPISEIELDPENISALHDLEGIIKEEAEREASNLINEQQATHILDEQYKESLTLNNENILPRLFFKHFQFLNEVNEGKTDSTILYESPELITDIKELDSTPKQLTQLIPILYYKDGASEFFIENYNDHYFNQIISGLGILIEENQLSGFNHLIKDMALIRHTQPFYEQVFVIPSMKSNNKEVTSLSNRRNL